uniref:Immediate early response 2a n=1 Tax=Hucho hucho TaxID=62062 RepID=A0A4W5PV74_9TELE
MEVSAEAKRIMVHALGKLYSSRAQRGGHCLHRSLLLTLVMQSARDIYHGSQASCETTTAAEPVQQESPMEETTGDPSEREVSSSLSGLPATPQPRESAVSSEDEMNAHPRHCSVTAGREDKENRGPSRPDRNSRKRLGKAAAEPDFLPCKKAKMEQGRNTIIRSSVNCYLVGGDSLASSVPMLRAIASF